jgi:uncharacterized membrane protein YdjX (TVP38/TMEM64 family)
MLKPKKGIILLILVCLIATALGIYLIGGISPDQIQAWLKRAGVWAPIIYVVLYTIATILVLPSTPLNLAGGAIFGPWLGTLWTTVAAVVAAIVAFLFTRTIGRDWVAHRLAGQWQAIDAEIQHGGLFYMFAIRLQPVIPYGLVNFAAGLTSVRFKDYVLGTALGTPAGVLPFVMLGSFGLKALRTGDILPLIGALGLVSLLFAGAGWYRHRRRNPQKDLQKAENSLGD